MIGMLSLRVLMREVKLNRVVVKALLRAWRRRGRGRVLVPKDNKLVVSSRRGVRSKRRKVLLGSWKGQRRQVER